MGGMATPAELEAYRQGYHAGIRTADAPTATGRRQYLLAAGTFAAGVGGVFAIVASRKPGGSGDAFAAFAIATALAAAALGATRVLLGEPTPTLRLK
jgi:hypothetical protein